MKHPYKDSSGVVFIRIMHNIWMKGQEQQDFLGNQEGRDASKQEGTWAHTKEAH